MSVYTLYYSVYVPTPSASEYFTFHFQLSVDYAANGATAAKGLLKHLCVYIFALYAAALKTNDNIQKSLFQITKTRSLGGAMLYILASTPYIKGTRSKICFFFGFLAIPLPSI